VGNEKVDSAALEEYKSTPEKGTEYWLYDQAPGGSEMERNDKPSGFWEAACAKAARMKPEKKREQPARDYQKETHAIDQQTA